MCFHEFLLEIRSSDRKIRVCLNVAGRDSRVEVASAGAGAGAGAGKGRG